MTVPFVVYNVLTKKNSDVQKIQEDFRTKQNLDSLYELKDELVNVETFSNPCADKIEIRFTFQSKEGHFSWINRNQIRYDMSVELLKQHWEENQVTWERYTSDDFYISEFQGQTSQSVKTLIDWKLSPVEKKAFIQHILPMGKHSVYKGNGHFEKTVDVHGARFLKERHGNIRRFGNSPKAWNKSNFPSDLITYHFDHCIDVLQYHLSDMYLRLKKLCYDVEAVAEQYIASCNYAAVIAGHKDLGESFALHSHRLDDYDRYTFTIVVRLTTDDNPAVFQAYQPYASDDPMLPFYYIHTVTSPETLSNYTKQFTPINIPLITNTSILTFNASYTPHTVIWSDDVYLFFVYDHVSFKQGVLDQMKQRCEHTYFKESGNEKCLMYHGMK